ncbi:vacuolar fusion protein MON1 homolog A [Anthonomus grandis grandis]|uniref:vacuolar fusion protein MON1 homolog A n=1 Tax=Anthonomus grandis grandis TaxID=2921223 RepID=UPI002164F425|nr:vacuolar fusion protein MON1 homolog A [Anthonomus grandis grandis]
MSEFDVEPGAARDSVLVASGSIDNFEQMSSSLEEIKNENSVGSGEDPNTLTSSNENQEDGVDKPENGATVEEDYEDSLDWAGKRKHIFVLSNAGKPIYSRHGNEDKLAWLFGVMLGLFKYSHDSIKSIHAGDTTYVFLSKKPLILVAVSKTGESVSQLTVQLNYVFNQIVSILTLRRLTKTYEDRANYDLRRLLLGVDRLIDHLLDFSEYEPAFMLGAIQCLPLAASERDSISKTIKDACGKIKNLVFAILLGNNRLITLVQMKKYHLHPADLHLIFNLVAATESLKNYENWTPLCLPRFDNSGFLYAHVSYLAEDCQACLILLTVEKDMFYPLNNAKQKIVEKLRVTNCLEHINTSLLKMEESAIATGFPELRHYLYKCKSTAQFYQPAICPPYTKDKVKLMELYKRAHQKMHSSTRPLKLSFERSLEEAVFSWDTKGFELYAVFEPLTETASAINCVSKLLNWIKKKEDRLFHLNAYTF